MFGAFFETQLERLAVNRCYKRAQEKMSIVKLHRNT